MKAINGWLRINLGHLQLTPRLRAAVTMACHCSCSGYAQVHLYHFNFVHRLKCVLSPLRSAGPHGRRFGHIGVRQPITRGGTHGDVAALLPACDNSVGTPGLPVRCGQPEPGKADVLWSAVPVLRGGQQLRQVPLQGLSQPHRQDRPVMGRSTGGGRARIHQVGRRRPASTAADTRGAHSASGRLMDPRSRAVWISPPCPPWSPTGDSNTSQGNASSNLKWGRRWL